MTADPLDTRLLDAARRGLAVTYSPTVGWGTCEAPPVPEQEEERAGVRWVVGGVEA